MTQITATQGAGQNVGDSAADSATVDDVCTRPDADRGRHHARPNSIGRLAAWLCERLIGAVCRGADLAGDCAKRCARRAGIAAVLYDRTRFADDGIIDLDDYRRAALWPFGHCTVR